MEYYSSIEVVAELSDAVASANGHTVTNNRYSQTIPVGSLYPLMGDLLDSYKTPPDKESFRQIVKSGRVKMSDYVHKKESTSYPLVRIPHVVANRAEILSGGELSAQTQTGSYNFVTDYNRLKYEDELEHREASAPPVQSKNSVLANVVQNASMSLDLLTEVAERRETMKLVGGTLEAISRPLQSFRDAYADLRRIRKNPKELAKRASDLWLKYRYGIMPLVYTMEDAMDVLYAQNRVYQRESSADEAYGKFPEPTDDYRCLYDTGTWSVTHRAVTKSRFSSGTLRQAHAIGVSFPRTTWEKIPYSFVVDWVLNVGSWLESQSFDLVDLASERKFCISTKTNKHISTWLNTHNPDIPEQTIEHSVDPGDYTFQSIAGAGERTHLVRELISESYVRKVVNPQDVEFEISPDLNVKQWIDSFALSLKPALRGIRSLRRLR